MRGYIYNQHPLYVIAYTPLPYVTGTVYNHSNHLVLVKEVLPALGRNSTGLDRVFRMGLGVGFGVEMGLTFEL